MRLVWLTSFFPSSVYGGSTPRFLEGGWGSSLLHPKGTSKRARRNDGADIPDSPLRTKSAPPIEHQEVPISPVNGGRKVLVFLALVVLSFSTNAAAKSAPDISGTWQLSCLDAYQDIVSTMNPAWIPDQLKNGFEISETTGEARLGGSPTVPWLTIYNKDLTPIYHAVGFNSRSDALWQLVIDQNNPTEFAPKLYEIEPYTGVRAVSLPQADFTFVEYEAKWCTNCKLVQGAMKNFIASHPNLKITHVQIEADTAKMQNKTHTSQTCPVTT